jgi:ribosome-binding protein aMBF1 (putative translation factor)
MADEPELDPTDRWFAANLKVAREQAGLSQEAVAQRMRERGFSGFRRPLLSR